MVTAGERLSNKQHVVDVRNASVYFWSTCVVPNRMLIHLKCVNFVN